ncbi:thioredoxin reductase (NADPH) [Actinomycetospora succinea]|uniref:Thioredoxin reductase (NADPH) n=1 Tax=Actinomycetospora succinea TaxID=663603 RepID=A0A4R6VM16_9PSEU|nr:FAD-dependent oxidoreductase [Actinomycetospora succinea]TDQ62969.1 thioredoxin reductase (NADPH) [Actinomycetospora succinea]
MSTDWDVVVVGAGIAGLTAARACAERDLRVVAHDALAPGGQLINLGALADWPGPPTTGPDLMGALLTDVMDRGVEIAYGEVTGLRADPLTVEAAEGPVTTRAVVVATGRRPGRLDVPGADAWEGRGLSHCATCDGPLHAGREVVVVGDDEWTAREALELAGIAKRVTLVGAAPGWSASSTRRLAEAVEVRTGTVTALEGDGTLGAVRLADGEVLDASGVFVYTHADPRSELLDGLPADAAVWSAGDVTGADRTLLTAAADGLRAGLAVVARLEES